MDKTIKELQADQPFLTEYFAKSWVGNRIHENYNHGWPFIIPKISESAYVLDVGCNKDSAHGRLPNNRVYGIDPAGHKADFVGTILEFEHEEKFDVAVSWGAINFGSQEKIDAEIAKLSSLLKDTAEVHMRCNPGVANHSNPDGEKIAGKFYPWTWEENMRQAKLHGFTVQMLSWDVGERFYAHWTR
jgi:hypothetical protein